MPRLSELEMLKIWKLDALEQMADNDRVIDELNKLLQEQNNAVAQISEAMHQAQLVINRYCVIKSEVMNKTQNKRKKVKN